MARVRATRVRALLFRGVLVVGMLFLGGSLAGGADLPSASPGGWQGEDRLRVGVIGPLRGPSAAYGISQLRGVEMARDDWNRSGLLPRPIDLSVGDDQGDMGRVAALARDLLFRNRVSAFVGCINSGCTHVLEMVCVKAHVPQVTAVSTDPTITMAGTPWIFRCLADDGQQAHALLGHLLRVHPGKTVALWIQGSRYGKRGGLEMGRRLREAGIDPLLEEVFPPGLAKPRPMVERLRRSRAQVLILWSLYGDGARLLRALASSGTRVPALLGPDGLALEAFSRSAGQAAEGMVVTWPFDGDRDDPQTRDFVEAFRRRHGVRPDSFAAHAYDALGLIARASIRGGSDPYALRAELARTRGCKGVTGLLAFDERGNDTRRVSLAVIRDGRFVRISSSSQGTGARSAPAAPARR